MKQAFTSILALLLISGVLFGQGDHTVTGKLTVGGTMDASTSVSSRPNKTGPLANRPTNCTAGDTYIATDGTGGQVLYAAKATGTPCTTWTLVGDGTGSAGAALATQYQGYYAPLGLGWNGTSTVFTANKPRWVQFVSPGAMTVGRILMYLTGASAGTYTQAALLNADGTLIARTAAIQNTPTGNKAYTFASPPTLAANTVYWLEISTDSTTAAWHSANAGLALMNFLNENSTTGTRVFDTTDAGYQATGSGASIQTPGALPPTGVRAGFSGSLPAFILAP